MNFQEALEQLLKGEYLTRAAWPAEGPESGFCVIMPEMKQIWRITLMPNAPQAGVYMLPIADLLANDWYVRDRNHHKPVIVEPVIE